MNDYALNTDITALYSILYYKRWQMLAGNDGNMLVEFNINDKFEIRDEASSLEGGWKVIRKKYVIFTLNNEIAFCRIAYYDSVVLILKIYGESQYFVLVSDDVELVKPKIGSGHIEDYVRGDKASLYKVDSLYKDDLKDEDIELMDASTWNARNRKPLFIDRLNKVLFWITQVVTAVCTELLGFPWYGILLYVSVQTFACRKLLRGVRNNKVAVALFFILIQLVFVYLAIKVIS